MADGTGTLNLSVNINNIDVVGIPVRGTVFNEYDDFGILLGLERLPSEKNKEYKQRLLDVFVNRANSTYLGMVNGVTRDVGLELFQPFRLRPIKTTGAYVGENPVYIFNGPFLELWRNKTGDVLEMEIDLFDQAGVAYTIKELYDYINANSDYFIADQLDTAYQYERSMTILNQSNVQLIAAEPVPPTTRFTLSLPDTDAGAIILNDVTFTDTFTFSNKVAAANLVAVQGDYYIDVYTGDVTVYSEASQGAIIRYTYIRYNTSYLTASPIIIHNMQNSNFNRIMFEQVLADDGLYYDGIPTEFGADLINELLSYYPLYFAK